MPNQIGKVRKFPGAGGGGGSDKHPLKWNFQGGGGSKAIVPSVGRRYGYLLELHPGSKTVLDFFHLGELQKLINNQRKIKRNFMLNECLYI